MRPDRLMTSSCKQTALDWEQASAGLAQQGINVIHARFGVVLSPRRRSAAQDIAAFPLGLGWTAGIGNAVLELGNAERYGPSARVDDCQIACHTGSDSL